MNKIVYAALLIGLTSTAVSAQQTNPAPVPTNPTTGAFTVANTTTTNLITDAGDVNQAMTQYPNVSTEIQDLVTNYQQAMSDLTGNVQNLNQYATTCGAYSGGEGCNSGNKGDVAPLLATLIAYTGYANTALTALPSASQPADFLSAAATSTIASPTAGIPFIVAQLQAAYNTLQSIEAITGPASMMKKGAAKAPAKR